MKTGMAMQITETSSEGLSREYTVVVPADDIEAKLVTRLTEIGQAVSVPGFRPGKVPMSLLKQRYSDSVRGEILERTIEETSQNALTERDLRPAMQPKIEIVTFEEGKDLEYKLGVELLPDIEPMDFSKLVLERLVADVADEEIDNAIQKLADKSKKFAPVEDARAAETGDQLLINFLGRVDGEEFEGGNAEDFSLDLGSGTFIPGFEDQLVGVTAGSKSEVTVTFPDEYPAENLKGKEAVFEVEVKEVRGAQPANIDDEFAKGMGLDDLKALRGAIRDQIKIEYAQLSRTRLKRLLLDELAEAHDFEVPRGMADQEFDAIWTQIIEAKGKDQLDEDDKGKSDDELRERYRPIAERRVRLGLLLSEVGRVNNLTVNQDDLNRAMTEQSRQFPGQEASIFEYYQKNPEAMKELEAPIFEEKVVDFIIEMANVTEKTVSIEELMADSDADSGDGDEDKAKVKKPKSVRKKGKTAAKKEKD